MTRKSAQPPRYIFAACPFPQDAWTASWRDKIKDPLNYVPADWKKQKALHVKPPPKASAIERECRTVLAATQLRPTYRDEILLQCEFAQALCWPVQRIVGNPEDPYPRPATIKIVDDANFESFPITFYFKTLYNRGRPYHCCDLPLDPMFQRPDRVYPGHPSYPSGHSTQAHMVARLFGIMFPWLEFDFELEADQVARNREIAGLHFASDSAAGKQLGIAIANALMESARFAALVDAARAEWPEVTRMSRPAKHTRPQPRKST